MKDGRVAGYTAGRYGRYTVGGESNAGKGQQVAIRAYCFELLIANSWPRPRTVVYGKLCCKDAPHPFSVRKIGAIVTRRDGSWQKNCVGKDDGSPEESETSTSW